jgi:hypothetical protein
VRKIEPSRALECAGQAAQSMPELSGYPITLQAPANMFTVELDPHPADSPADSLLVQYLATDALKQDRAFRDCRYWVDPAKGYVTRRYVLADARNPDGSASTDTYTMEELERSPRGIWYPTLVRRKVTQVPPPDAPNYVDETVTRYFLDFDAGITDELFRPADREIRK